MLRYIGHLDPRLLGFLIAIQDIQFVNICVGKLDILPAAVESDASSLQVIHVLLVQRPHV